MKRLFLLFLMFFVVATSDKVDAHAADDALRQFGKDVTEAGKQIGKAGKKVGKDIARAGKKIGKGVKDSTREILQD
jgi:hypothetical protein